MKKVLTLMMALLLVCGLAGCGGSKEAAKPAADQPAAPAAEASADVVKLGIYEPASGDNGPGGKQETLGYYYANFVQPTVTVGDKEYTVALKSVAISSL